MGSAVEQLRAKTGEPHIIFDDERFLIRKSRRGAVLNVVRDFDIASRKAEREGGELPLAGIQESSDHFRGLVDVACDIAATETMSTARVKRDPEDPLTTHRNEVILGMVTTWAAGLERDNEYGFRTGSIRDAQSLLRMAGKAVLTPIEADDSQGPTGMEGVAAPQSRARAGMGRIAHALAAAFN